MTDNVTCVKIIGCMVDNKPEFLVPPLEIPWGRITYAPNGDDISRTLGISRVYLKDMSYELVVFPDNPEKPFLRKMAIRPSLEGSRIYLGYPRYNEGDNVNWLIKIQTTTDQPFNLDDHTRATGMVDLAKKLAQLRSTELRGNEIASQGLRYLDALRTLFTDVSPSLLRTVAALETEVTKFTPGSVALVEQFLKVADEMDSLGLAVIEGKPESLGERHYGFSDTPDWLRRAYGQKVA